MADLKTDVRYIKGIGEQRAKALGKLGIATLQDLISYFPRAYEDRTALRTIAELAPGEAAGVAAMVASPPTVSHIRKGLDLVKLRAVDDTGELNVTFFNQSWLKNSLRQGETYIFYGRAEGSLFRRQMANPVVEPEGRREITGRIVPIYPLTAGVSQLILSRSVRQGLSACADILPDVLPDRVRREHHLCRIEFAYENIHFPESAEALDLARRRLAFEELFLFTIGGPRAPLRQRGHGALLPVPALHPDGRPAPLRGGGPGGHALRHPHEPPGPGGCGLRQDYGGRCLRVFLREERPSGGPDGPHGDFGPAALSGPCPPAGKFGHPVRPADGLHPRQNEKIHRRPAGERGDRLCHRHPRPHHRRPGLPRPGAGGDGRAAPLLAAKGDHPHILVMSATPIPRTLALILYGDLDVSVIDQLPPGRRPVETFAVSGGYRRRIYDFIRKLVAEGRQAYIVCPMVEENDQLPDERKAVTEYAKKLQAEVFPDLRVAYVHGKMKPKEKDAVMTAFAARETDILVSTTVIEVGVDVPNAAVMVVENAERFGLSQLHQLRGRVGRGKHQSYCILISDNRNEETRARLKVMTKTADGFRIAEEDLRLRGPGDFFGQRQHGLPGLKVTDLGCDTLLLQEAQAAARQLLTEDPELASCPAAAERVADLFAQQADALN